jgi:hypothetical protein
MQRIDRYTEELRDAGHRVLVQPRRLAPNMRRYRAQAILDRHDVHDSKLGRVDGGDMTDRARSPGIRHRAVAKLEKHLRLGWVRTARLTCGISNTGSEHDTLLGLRNVTSREQALPLSSPPLLIAFALSELDHTNNSMRTVWTS